MHVLVAEDDPRMADLLEQALAESGWRVDVVGDGRTALASARDTARYDVLLLDRGLPGADGLSVCRTLRAEGVTTPVLMLTARGAVPDRIAGLDGGADDYLAKPFDLDELLARLRALHRRGNPEPAVLRAGGLVLDPEARTVSRGEVPIDLTTREFDVLRLLLARAGAVVSRYEILQEVWDGDTDLRSNVIDVYLASIRAKVDKPFGTSTVTTVRGAGYRVEAG